MSIQTAIYSRLINNATVGAAVGTKVFPVFAPAETAYPFIVFQIISQSPTLVKDGVSPLDEVSLQVDIYSHRHQECYNIAVAVRSSLDGWTSTADKIKVVFDNESDAPPDLGLEVFAKSQDYNIRQNRTS